MTPDVSSLDNHAKAAVSGRRRLVPATAAVALATRRACDLASSWRDTFSCAPPDWSVRRVAETRLQQRWFVLSNRALRWYSDATMRHPLSSLPLELVTSCEPKRAESKHTGKFYVASSGGHRALKLVAADTDTMSEWVEAINGARAVLDELRDSESTVNDSRRSTVGELSGDGGWGLGMQLGGAARNGAIIPISKAQGSGALAEPGNRLAQRVAEEFVVLSDLDGVEVGVIELATDAQSSCAASWTRFKASSGATLQGRLDRAYSGHSGVVQLDGRTRRDIQRLGRYCASIFAHLGFFVDADSLLPPDVL